MTTKAAAAVQRPAREIEDMKSEVLNVHLALLDESPFNPRKHYGDLGELAASMAPPVGVLQPLTVRPSKKEGHYEVVFGHRRLRAARLAGLKGVPVIVRQMDDNSAREVQIIENLQREDVHPMDEAEGLDALVKGGASVEEVAKKIGRSAGHVYGRLKLLALVPDARKAFLDSKIPATIALAISRCPPEVQKRAARRIATLDEEPTYRQGLDILRREFGVALAPEFDHKKEEEAKAVFEKLADEAKASKRKILSHEENRAVYTYGNEHTAFNAPFREPKDPARDGISWGKLLGRKLAEMTPVLGRRPDGSAVWLYSAEDLDKAAAPLLAEAKGNAPKASPKEIEAEKKRKERWRREQEMVKLRQKTTEAALADALPKVRKTRGGRPFWAFMVEAQLAGDTIDEIAMRHGAEDGKALWKKIERMNEADLRALAFDLAVGWSITRLPAHGYGEELKSMCKLLHLDLKAIETKVRQAAEAKDEEQ